MQHPVSPIVQSEVKSISAQLLAKVNQHAKTVRLGLTERVQIGNLAILLKSKLPHGQFLPEIKKMGMDAKYLQACMRHSRGGYTKKPDDMSPSEIQEEINAYAAEEEENDTPNSSNYHLTADATTDDVPDFGTPTPPKTTAQASPVPKTEEKPPEATEKPPEGERHPGDDSAAEAEFKRTENARHAHNRSNGKEESGFSIKTFNHGLHLIVSQVDKLALKLGHGFTNRQGGQGLTPSIEHSGLLRKAEELRAGTEEFKKQVEAWHRRETSKLNGAAHGTQS